MQIATLLLARSLAIKSFKQNKKIIMKKQNLKNRLKLGKKVISNLEQDKVLGGRAREKTSAYSCPRTTCGA